jgi:carbon catabolite-derepressing protein kinase
VRDAFRSSFSSPFSQIETDHNGWLSLAGGIFSLPPFLTPDARSLLSRMLTVDSNKRIKLHEIRQTPWFQQDLPSYLFPPLAAHFSPRPDEDVEEIKGSHDHVEQAGQPPVRRRLSEDLPSSGGDSGGEGESRTPTLGDVDRSLGALTPLPGAGTGAGTPDTPGRRREWIEGLGVVDQEVVDDLCSKIPALTSDEVWATLKEGADRELRIAYQLCRDNLRMREGSHYDDGEAVQSFYAPPGDVRFSVLFPFLFLPTR